MTPETVVRLLAEPDRMRVLAAVALGARTTDGAARASGLSTKAATVALRRLRDHGLVRSDDDGLRLAYERLRDLSRAAADSPGDDRRPEAGDPVLRVFVRDGRLVGLPAQRRKREVVLRHIAETTFAPQTEYDEATVNDLLRAWCEGADTDHVTIRRYLIEARLLFRADGVYWRELESTPEPGEAERYVRAMGLG